VDEPAEAIAAARSSAARGEIVCVTGSLALVGRARDVLGLPIAERLW
jgi:folylpolyglutamate synthase/dihydropteroate synthase